MKKGIAAGIAGLLMMGTASQALASFETNHLVMSIYDTASNQEMGIDLGNITTMDLSSQNVVLASGLSFDGWNFNKYTSGIGLWTDVSDEPNNLFSGYFGITNATGTAKISSTYTNAVSFWDNEMAIRGAYGRLDTNSDGITTLAATHWSSYATLFNLAPANYAGLHNGTNYEAEFPLTADYVDLYLYQFTTDMDTWDIVQDGGIKAVFRLTADGQVILNPNATPGSEVPVPGAAWLLGSGLIGLAGLRRRFNG